MTHELRKLTALLLALVLLGSLCACAKGSAELKRGSGMLEEEPVAEQDENPDAEPERAGMPVLQSVSARLDGVNLTSDFYFYRALLSADYQTAYDQIRDGINNCLEVIPLSVNVPKTDLQTIYLSVLYDSPELFWAESKFSYSYNKSGFVTKVKPAYNDLAKNTFAASTAMEKAVEEALADMWSLSTDAEKVKYAHDYLTNKIDYTIDTPYNQTAYAALVNGKCVCAGYAHAFQYMMQKMGIRCAFVVGDAGGGMHAWNLVELGGEFYAMDVTWDDPLGAKPTKYYYDYFNLTSTQMGKDHTLRAISSGLPQATGTAQNYQNGFGGNRYGTDFAAIKGTLPEGYGTGGGYLEAPSK